MSAIDVSSRNALPANTDPGLAASAPSGAQFLAQRTAATEPPRGVQQAAASTGTWDGTNRISPNPPGDAPPTVTPPVVAGGAPVEPVVPPELAQRIQLYETMGETKKAIDLFTSKDAGLPPKLQSELAQKFTPDDAQRKYILGLPDSSAGGRVAAPNFLKAFQEATGEIPNFIVFGDDGRAPYGALGPEDLQRTTNNMFNAIDAFNPDNIAGVCNTLHIGVDMGVDSTTAYTHLIDNTAKAIVESAANGDTKPVVLATPATVTSGIYNKYITEISGGTLTPIEVAAPHFAPAVNQLDHMAPEGSPERIALQKAADVYVKQVPQDATSVWLCCTHYPALTKDIQDALDRAGKGHVKIVDPMEAQGHAAAEKYWGWKLTDGAKTPGKDFDPFMVTSANEQDLPAVRAAGDLYIGGDPNSPIGNLPGNLPKTIPMISLGDFGEVTPKRLEAEVAKLPGEKPLTSSDRLPVMPWNNPSLPLSDTERASIQTSYETYRAQGGFDAPTTFFNGIERSLPGNTRAPTPGIANQFDEAQFLRGEGPSLVTLAEEVAAEQTRVRTY
jgi:glutamate racemase